jgi:hypothetical protein
VPDKSDAELFALWDSLVPVDDVDPEDALERLTAPLDALEEIVASERGSTLAPENLAVIQRRQRARANIAKLPPAKAVPAFRTRLKRLFGGGGRRRALLSPPDIQRLAEILCAGYGRDGFWSWRRDEWLAAAVDQLPAPERARFDQLEQAANARAWHLHLRERGVLAEVSPDHRHATITGLRPGPATYTFSDGALVVRVPPSPRSPAGEECARAADYAVMRPAALASDPRILGALAWKCARRETRVELLAPAELLDVRVTLAVAARAFGASPQGLRSAWRYLQERSTRS